MNIGSGAVLIASLGAAIVGTIIFVNRLRLMGIHGIRIPGTRTDIDILGEIRQIPRMVRLARLVVPGLPHHIYAAITSDPKATQFDTYFIVFTLKAVTPTELELRGEQDGEDVSVTLDSSIGTRVFAGEALEVHRVSDTE